MLKKPIQKKHLYMSVVAIYFVLLIYGLSKPKQSVDEPEKSTTKQTVASGKSKKKQKKATFTIISQHVVPGIKRGLDVRLDQKVTADELAEIAHKIKSSDPNYYKKTFIGYYLPGMDVGAGGWATSDFKPNLNVEILGLTIEQENLLRQQPSLCPGSIIGSWIWEGGRRKITILRDGEKIFVDKLYAVDVNMIEEYVQISSPYSGIAIQEKAGNHFDEYYLIDQNYDLYVCCEEIKMFMGKRIRL